jgi:hypothetical protein
MDHPYRRLEDALRSLCETDALFDEWKLIGHEIAETPQKCECGHPRIIEVFALINKYNDITITIGNCCIEAFDMLNSLITEPSTKRVANDLHLRLSPYALFLAFREEILSLEDLLSYTRSWSKNKKQLECFELEERKRINELFLTSLGFHSQEQA